ncbi:MAG: MlaC/ttg2D family ABC transporter substrate-binding protein [Bacteroidota bacterium]
MKIAFFVLILSFCMPLTNSVAQPASSEKEQEIRSILEERDRQIKELLGPKGAEYTDEQRSELRDIINDIIDYRAMAKVALNEKFQELSSEEQEEFVDLFSTIIRDQSLQQMDIYRAEIVYEDIEVDDNKAKVTTTAILDNRRIPVLYRMNCKDGQWSITDMSIDDAWTAESYRRSFQNIIRRRGYDALITNLRKRAEEA